MASSSESHGTHDMNIAHECRSTMPNDTIPDWARQIADEVYGRIIDAEPMTSESKTVLALALVSAERRGLERAEAVANEYVWDDHALKQATAIGKACHHQSLEIATAIRKLMESSDEA